MDEVLGVFSNVGRVLAFFGGGIAVITLCFAGFQFMTGAGDAQKMSQARMSLIGTVGGLILVGVAFLVPRVVSEGVTEQVGGVPIFVRGGGSCDDVLRSHVVLQTAVSTTSEFRDLVSSIQGSRSGCRREIWNPVVWHLDVSNLANCFGGGSQDEFAEVGGQRVPSSLKEGGRRTNTVRGLSGRDADNNILVYFRVNLIPGADRNEFLPGDGTVCWMYLAGLGVWVENYMRP